MATHTTNYGLTKPGATDPIDIEVLNENFDTIDREIKAAADAIPPVATQEVAGIVKPDGTTVTVDPDGTIHGAQTYVLPIASAAVLGGVKVGNNLTVDPDGRLNALPGITKDDAPTHGSQNVPKSGGTFDMIDAVDQRVDGLEGRVDDVETQVGVLTTGIEWKTAVASFSALATTYPTPETGWTVTCLDTGQIYQWNGEAWVFVMRSILNVAPVADVRAVLAMEQ